ncbi:uncharacterized protein EI90DRAFT_3038720 [Cantharellus anzutake]|uniref:uncharacterized protein n=1 Tax=Cantharellus anzutake TaxID=1750568 RepID=UPI0019072418|nr:uncharacterized protein EI90DRAFT_3038720 [Cantharellus anzutake]KAF8339989.1 hypothetical protein EI90DRAFT_3038720 [Cantharellus anzutake]
MIPSYVLMYSAVSFTSFHQNTMPLFGNNTKFVDLPPFSISPLGQSDASWTGGYWAPDSSGLHGPDSCDMSPSSTLTSDDSRSFRCPSLSNEVESNIAFEWYRNHCQESIISNNDMLSLHQYSPQTLTQVVSTFTYLKVLFPSNTPTAQQITSVLMQAEKAVGAERPPTPNLPSLPSANGI